MVNLNKVSIVFGPVNYFVEYQKTIPLVTLEPLLSLVKLFKNACPSTVQLPGVAAPEVLFGPPGGGNGCLADGCFGISAFGGK